MLRQTTDPLEEPYRLTIDDRVLIEASGIEGISRATATLASSRAAIKTLINEMLDVFAIHALLSHYRQARFQRPTIRNPKANREAEHQDGHREWQDSGGLNR